MGISYALRTSVVAIVSLVSLAVVAPATAQVPDPDQAVAAAPAAPSWDEISGYGSVEANRAIGAPVDTVMLGGALVSRSSDLGSLQEEYLAAPMAPATIANQAPADVRFAPAAAAWDDLSGYGTVEASRAAIGVAPVAPVSTSRVSRATDIGSLQEASLAAPATSSVVVDRKFGPR